MSDELRKARRELGRLELQRDLIDTMDTDSRAKLCEYNRMASDLARQIKRQELEVRRVALAQVGWHVCASHGGGFIAFRIDGSKVQKCYRKKETCVAWAERQNRKAGG